MIKTVDKLKEKIADVHNKEVSCPPHIYRSFFEPAADIIRSTRKKIIILSDYDADGLTGGAQMYQLLMMCPHLDHNINWFSPERSEGYGLTEAFLSRIKDDIRNTELIICIDFGTTQYDMLSKFMSECSSSVKAIIFDHHTIPEPIPSAPNILLVNPYKRMLVPDSCPPSIESVCASGLVRLFVDYYNDSQINPLGLQLAAIGTIADMVPLVGINRSLVQFGLYHFLFFDENDIAFRIAPAINACSRVGCTFNAIRIFKKMIGDGVFEYNEFQNYNVIRKETQARLSNNILEEDTPLSNAVYAKLPDESYGYIGLIAQSLARKNKKPAFVFCCDNTGKIVKFSCRSYGNIDILKTMTHYIQTHCTEAVQCFKIGGHASACGFSILNTCELPYHNPPLELFLARLYKLELMYQDKSGDEYELYKINSDIELNEAYHLEICLAPFGVGNLSPIYYSYASIEVLWSNPAETVFGGRVRLGQEYFTFKTFDKRAIPSETRPVCKIHYKILHTKPKPCNSLFSLLLIDKDKYDLQ